MRKRTKTLARAQWDLATVGQVLAQIGTHKSKRFMVEWSWARPGHKWSYTEELTAAHVAPSDRQTGVSAVCG